MFFITNTPFSFKERAVSATGSTVIVEFIKKQITTEFSRSVLFVFMFSCFSIKQIISFLIFYKTLIFIYIYIYIYNPVNELSYDILKILNCPFNFILNSG